MVRRSGAIIIVLGITLLAVLGFFGYYGSRILFTRPPRLSSGWYIDPPEDYFCLKDKTQNKVVQWLQRMPYQDSLLGLRSKCPYTFETWLEQGRELGALEETLLSLYGSQYKSLLMCGLQEALTRYGTQESIVFIVNRLQQQGLSQDAKVELYDLLFRIVKDREVYSMYITGIEKGKPPVNTCDPNDIFFK